MKEMDIEHSRWPLNAIEIYLNLNYSMQIQKKINKLPTFSPQNSPTDYYSTAISLRITIFS